jgi:hypothetical protein
LSRTKAAVKVVVDRVPVLAVKEAVKVKESSKTLKPFKIDSKISRLKTISS